MASRRGGVSGDSAFRNRQAKRFQAIEPHGQAGMRWIFHSHGRFSF